MKARILKPSYGTLLLLATTFLMVLMSCKRSADNMNANNTTADDVAKSLDGTILTGNMMMEGDANELMLNYNSGSKIIIISKLKNAEYPNIPNMQAAEIIVSIYGLMLKDATSNQIFLLANNDTESIGKFARVKSILGNRANVVLIFGTTVINNGRA